MLSFTLELATVDRRKAIAFQINDSDYGVANEQTPIWVQIRPHQ